MVMVFNVKTYWRFRGEKVWMIGYPQREDHGLVRMATHNGAPYGGPVVGPNDIEYKQ